MRRARILPADAAGVLEAAVAAIRAGDLVAIPTETVYGIACALDPGALERVTTAKGRPEGRAITLLVDSLDQVTAIAELPSAATRLMERFWPGALTVVVRLRPDIALPGAVTGEDVDGRPTVGFRLPDHPVPRALARELGPLPVTSANRSGEPEAPDAESIAAVLGDRVALILDGGPAHGGVPSTVVAVRGDGSIEVLREAALSRTAVEETLA